ncbi:uncharacterized protein ARMOST_19985 [Armillaria ostoyae]|uniref:Uncharacterized protein n=1 Tax=Armillaria ostoyae TaxID=47428 RepID=A0A284S643_ARMOS|nr:uncharacterized protein ARMOST_19985 [Armillaria ostoyae]
MEVKSTTQSCLRGSHTSTCKDIAIELPDLALSRIAPASQPKIKTATSRSYSSNTFDNSNLISTTTDPITVLKKDRTYKSVHIVSER